MANEIRVSQLNEMVEDTPLEDNYYSLKSDPDLGLSDHQAFALAWFVMYKTQPDILKQMDLPTTIVDCAEKIGKSRPTLYKWLNDQRLINSGIQHVVNNKLSGLLLKSFDRLGNTISHGKDSDANSAIRIVLDYEMAKRNQGEPDVQVNIQLNNHVNQALTKIYGDHNSDE